MSTRRISEYVERVISDAPPLTDEQRASISRLLHPAARAASKAGGRR